MKRKNYAMITGYASVFNNVDAEKHVVLDSAFIGQDFARRLPIILQHNTKKLLGYVLNHRNNNYGLYIEAVVFTENELQCEAVNLMKQNRLNGMSVGMKVLNASRRNNILYINRARLDEISLTSNPVNQLCRIQSCTEF